MPSAASASLSPISSVTMDLTLMTSVSPVALISSATMRLASAASRAQCTWPPASVTFSSRQIQVLVQVPQRVIFDLLARLAKLFPVTQQFLGHRLRALVPDRVRGVREVAAQLLVLRRDARGLGERGHAEIGPAAAHRTASAPE